MGQSQNFGDSPGGQPKEFCLGWAFGWNEVDTLLNPPYWDANDTV